MVVSAKIPNRQTHASGMRSTAIRPSNMNTDINKSTDKMPFASLFRLGSSRKDKAKKMPWLTPSIKMISSKSNCTSERICFQFRNSMSGFRSIGYNGTEFCLIYHGFQARPYKTKSHYTQFNMLYIIYLRRSLIYRKPKTSPKFPKKGVTKRDTAVSL